MEKHITYTEKELKETLVFMSSSLDTIQFYMRLLTEQQDGKRTNLSVDSFENIQEPAENIRRCIDYFKMDIKQHKV